LLGVQRLGHDALGGTLFYVFTIGFKHRLTLISGPILRPGAGAPKCIRQGKTGEAAGRTAVAPDAFRWKLFSKFYAGCWRADRQQGG